VGRYIFILVHTSIHNYADANKGSEMTPEEHLDWHELVFNDAQRLANRRRRPYRLHPG